MTHDLDARGASPSAQLADSSQLVLGLILVLLCLGISIGAPQFYSEANIIAILRQCALVLIVASGMTMLLITAEVDLSVGASLAFVGCVGMAVHQRDRQPDARHARRARLRRRGRAVQRPRRHPAQGQFADRHDRAP